MNAVEDERGGRGRRVGDPILFSLLLFSSSSSSLLLSTMLLARLPFASSASHASYSRRRVIVAVEGSLGEAQMTGVDDDDDDDDVAVIILLVMEDLLVPTNNVLPV